MIFHYWLFLLYNPYQAFLFSGSKKDPLNCVKPTAVTWLSKNEFVISDGRQLVFYSTRLQGQGKTQRNFATTVNQKY